LVPLPILSAGGSGGRDISLRLSHRLTLCLRLRRYRLLLGRLLLRGRRGRHLGLRLGLRRRRRFFVFWKSLTAIDAENRIICHILSAIRAFHVNIPPFFYLWLNNFIMI
jgi:hypothetical protein